jgi:hypothetical protein
MNNKDHRRTLETLARLLKNGQSDIEEMLDSADESLVKLDQAIEKRVEHPVTMMSIYSRAVDRDLQEAINLMSQQKDRLQRTIDEICAISTNVKS